MDYLFWSLPVVTVAVLIGSGRASSAMAGLSGLVVSAAVALTAVPSSFGPLELILSAAHGAWLALLVGAVILGGLFFHEAVSGEESRGDATPVPAKMRRRQLYMTCFLVGPFAEAATGFGVGQATIAPVLKNIGLAPLHAVLLGLFSQIMVPWGALANGTIVGAQLSGLAPETLGVYSAILTVPLLLAWLGLFWRMAAAAGIPGTTLDLGAEIAWTLGAAVLLVVCNAYLGPEVAALAALGPLIAVRLLVEQRANHGRWRSILRVGLPYGTLILGLAATRAIQPVNKLFSEIEVRPFADGPIWLPLLHPGSWLLVIGLITAFATGHAAGVPDALRQTWNRGRKPIVAIVLFLAMAQIMVASGIAGGLAKGLTSSLGVAAVLATPLLAGLFGFLTSSGNATNGLLMPAQAALAAETGLNLRWIASIQNVAAGALTMLSPVRLAMGCALAGRPDLERAVYARAWPLGAAPLFLLVAVALVLILF